MVPDILDFQHLFIVIDTKMEMNALALKLIALLSGKKTSSQLIGTPYLQGFL